VIARTTRGHHGIADYLLTGKRSDSKLTREQKDRVVPLYGNLEVFKATEKYLTNYKNYKDNYIHITLSFSQKDMDKLNEIEDEQKRDELFKELVLLYLKHHTSGYDLEQEVIAYAEAHLPKIQRNVKNKQRMGHLHIVIAKYNCLDDTQLKTTFFNSSFMEDILQSYVCKKYGFEIPRDVDKFSDNKDTENEDTLVNQIISKMAITRAKWIELLKEIQTIDELLHFLENDLKLKKDVNYKIAGSKTYKYIKILNLQERNKRSNHLNINGKDFQRFILKDDENRTFPKDKPKKELEDILSSYYKRRIDLIYKRKSKKTKELLKNIQIADNKKSTSKENKFTYQTYQQKLFNQHYDYLINDKLKGYYISKVGDEVTIKNFSKNIQIIDKGDQILSLTNSNNIQEQVRLMIEISLAKDWELENIQASGSEEFINEANKQIANLLLLKNQKQNKKDSQSTKRPKTYTQKINEDLKEKEFQIQSKNDIDIKTLKEKLDPTLVLEYAVIHFKLDAKNFDLTSDNKIDNLLNAQKPKNVIDFLQKELNLTTKESIEICKSIYEKQENEQNSNISSNKEKKAKRIGVKI
jgi:hypothetical protein